MTASLVPQARPAPWVRVAASRVTTSRVAASLWCLLATTLPGCAPDTRVPAHGPSTLALSAQPLLPSGCATPPCECTKHVECPQPQGVCTVRPCIDGECRIAPGQWLDITKGIWIADCCIDANDCASTSSCLIPSCKTNGSVPHGLCGGQANDADPNCCNPYDQYGCNDANVCTYDACDNDFTCKHFAIAGCCADGKPCDDGDACTTEVCDPKDGFCKATAIVGCCSDDADCHDGNACTADTCSGPGGSCSHTTAAGTCSSDAGCDDGLACTKDACVNCACLHQADQAAGCCLHAADCDDGNACTIDSCDGASHLCSHAAIAHCCKGLEPAVCDDGDSATFDACINGWCRHF